MKAFDNNNPLMNYDNFMRQNSFSGGNNSYPMMNPYQMPLEVPMLPLYGYDNSEELDKDCEYMKFMYPKSAKRIQKEVEEECDKLEYDGSCMFDEFPDRVHLSIIVNNIFVRINKMEAEAQEVRTEQLEFRDGRRPGMNQDDWDRRDNGRRDHDWDRRDNGRRDHDRDHRGNDSLRDLIEIMLFNEMQQRRRRYRSRKRWF